MSVRNRKRELKESEKKSEKRQNNLTEDPSQDESREVRRFASGMFRAWIAVTVLIILFCGAGAFVTVHFIKKGRSSAEGTGRYKKTEYSHQENVGEDTGHPGGEGNEMITDVSELTDDFLEKAEDAVVRRMDSDDSGDRDAGEKEPVYLGAYVIYSADQNDSSMILVYSEEYKSGKSEKAQKLYRAFVFSPVTRDGSGNPQCDTEPMEYMNRVVTGKDGEYVTGFENLDDLYLRVVQRGSDFTCSATEGLPVK